MLSFRHIKLILAAAMLALMPATAWSQSKAAKAMEEQRYSDAIRLYEKFVKRHPEDGNAHEQLAIAYQYLRRFEDAQRSYAQADLLGDLSETSMVNYGQMLLRNGHVAEAKAQFNRYLSYEPESFLVRLLIQSIDHVSQWDALPGSYEVRALEGLNSSFSDFCPYPYQDGIAFITGRNEDLVNDKASPVNDLPYLAVYYAELDDEYGLVFSRPKNFLTGLYGDYHVGPISIDTAHQEIFYSQVVATAKEDETAFVSTYSAKIHKGKKTRNNALLPFGSGAYNVAHPAVSPSGNMLIFSSDMPGGQGGMDLYFVTRSGSEWSAPQALPPSVNSPLNDVFPYILNDTVLYFASNGHAGYGGLDVFETHYRNGQWTTPVNLRAPINSSGDDFGIVFVNSTSGYFSSERYGGLGKDDIYRFTKVAPDPEQERNNVKGEFVYQELPREGVVLNLLDENDNLLQSVVTDSLGRFAFANIPPNTQYKIVLSDEEGTPVDGGEIYLLNDDNQRVALLQRIDEHQFAFQSLPRDEFDALPLLDAQDKDLQRYVLFGQLFTEAPAIPAVGISVQLFDDQNNLLATILTDSMGFYEFDNLSEFNHYRVRVDGRDSVVYRTSVFTVDEGGVPVRLAADDSTRFSIERASPPEAISSGNEALIPTRGIVEIDGKPVAGARITSFRETALNMNATLTSASGIFDLGALPSEQAFYLLLPDSLASLSGTMTIYLLDRAGRRVQQANRVDHHIYTFTTLAPDVFDPSSLVRLNEKEGESIIDGQIFFKLPGDAGKQMSIVALGEDGKLVEMAQSDAQGHFTFHKLEKNIHYHFKLVSSTEMPVNVALFNKDGSLLELLRFGELDAYVYSKLNGEPITLNRDVETDQQLLLDASIRGMIYKKLPGDYKPGMLVYAYDEHGNKLDSAYTDAQGRFHFEHIQRDEDFTLRVMDESESGLNLALFGNQGQFEGVVSLDHLNQYAYSKIMMEAVAALGIMEEEESDALRLRGMIYKKVPGDYGAGVTVYAVDADGNIIDMAVLDSNGRFVFSKLDRDANYMVRLAEEDTEAQFALTDLEGNLLYAFMKGEAGWEFEKIASEKAYLAMQEEEEEGSLMASSTFPSAEPTPNDKSPVPTGTIDRKPVFEGTNIYYDRRQVELTREDRQMLTDLARSVRGDSNSIIHIRSHVDPAEAYTQWSISAERSALIAQHLVMRGVSMRQIYIQNFEYLEPIVTCPEGTECSDEDRALNRRAEIAVTDRSNMPAPADFIVTYGFDEWLLTTEGDAQVYRAINALRKDPSLRIVLEGYTDSWGAFEVNNRISELRVNNIERVLLAAGISQDRIDVIWHGESIPTGGCLVAYPCPVADRQQNRRVEIRLKK